MTSISGNQKKCASCQYFNGPRQLADSSKKNVRYDDSGRGKGTCDLNNQMKPPSSNCTKWQKWGHLI